MTESTTRTVIVTGGGTGIGRAIALAFIQQGERVYILGRRADVLEAAAHEIGATAIQADVSQRAQVEAAVAEIVTQAGTVDVLVNNAGFVRRTLTTMPLEEVEAAYDAMMDAGVKGTLLMSVAVAPHLRRPGGRIINLGSIAAFIGGSRPGSAVYAASKGAIQSLTYGLARELGPEGVTVNAIAPGLILETEFGGGFAEERIRATVAQTPMGRPGVPEDVAAAALYLASPGASFVTGEVLNVNGGWLMGH